MEVVQFVDWGNIEYGTAWEYQEQLMKQNLEIKAEWFQKEHSPSDVNTKHYFILCEHPHVYTLGKSGAIEHLLLNDQRLKTLGVSFYKTNRGGDITYHGPQQIVGYPILDLEKFTPDLGKYMRNLEEVIIQTIKHWGIVGDRLEGSTGVWIDAGIKGKERKICAMGVRSSRWVTMHGFALNVNTDLKYFDYIVPCGISDKGVTSIEKEIGNKVSLDEVKTQLIKNFEIVFDAVLEFG